MPISLGLDIGSNSVGSAWVDSGTRQVVLGVSVFPAGVAEADGKLGKPKNQARSRSRSLRRGLARRAERKHRLRRVLTDAGLLPAHPAALAALTNANPWHLRRKGLHEPLTPLEFGRVLVHLNQRRGALGIETDPEDESEGRVKEAIDHTRAEMAGRSAETFGQMMADLYDERQHATGSADKKYCGSIRNRPDAFEFHADRSLIRDEFARLWQTQKSFGGALAVLLTGDLRRRLDDPTEDGTWRHRGEIFGQRRTYWKTGTLGRCDLEPTDHRCPRADMYAQEFLVLEGVNNLRVTERGKPKRPLDGAERAKVIAALRKQKTAKLTTVKKALGVKKTNEAFYSFSLEDKDPDRDVNTDRFYREIIHEVFTEDGWNALNPTQRDAVNRSMLKFDPDKPENIERLESGAQQWWGLSAEAAARLIAAWRKPRSLEKPVNLSRRAIRNLLPYLRAGLSVTEARQRFAEEEDSPATPQQRVRYAHTITTPLRTVLARQVGEGAAQRLIAARGSTKSDRQYVRKHADPLPPAPTLANPVVRKAIHEVRRHILAYWPKFRQRPDRIVIELARETKQSERVRNERLKADRARERERKAIIEEYQLAAFTPNQQCEAVDRVLLCRQQGGICAYSNPDGDSGHPITEEAAAHGIDVEIDHIVPLSRSRDRGLNNKVLCLRSANRNKGNQTVKEWLSADQFAHLLQRFARWKDDKKQKRKWENLNRDAPAVDDFVASQLTDTAYAARQVAGFLRSALYADDPDNRQRIFFTKGAYTAQLRRDWQLQEEGGPKPRVDHRHHAIDATVIALTTPERLQDLAHFTAEQERARAASDRWPRRQPLSPPWGDVQTFRAQILRTVESQIVSHRAVKRKVVGAFHEETLYGPVFTRHGRSETFFTNRIRAEGLTPNHLRVPDGWDALSDQVHEAAMPKAMKRELRRKMGAMEDPPPAKSGIVRDRELRDQIRRCVREKGLDPDNFTKDDIKKLVAKDKLCMSSGVPIKRVILLRTINDPVLIPRKKWDHAAGRQARDNDPRTIRAYIGGNNHHIEIREEDKTGKWSGEVIDNFTAAQRVRRDKLPAVDRSDDPQKGGRFVMSLAEGETIYMRPTKTSLPGFFVVFKLEKPQRVHFVQHWDARPAKVRKDDDGRDTPDSNREEVSVVASKLKDLGPAAGIPPHKVRVSPLGDISRLERD